MGIVVCLIATLVMGALAYSLLSIVAALRFRAFECRESRDSGNSGNRARCLPEPISVLKPLSGLDDGLEKNLRGFFEQDYEGPFELIFAVRHDSDPCVPLVTRLCAEYANVPSRFILTGEPPYPHAKVYSLARMMAVAKHEVIVMSDSDIRVTRDFLRRIAAEFADPETALATCPYRAVGGASVWSRMEAEGMNTTFWQGAFTAKMLEGMTFAVGPTMVVRRKFIDEAGGIASLKDYLAEDFELGRRMAAAGHRVILSSYVVEHRIGSETAAQNFEHRKRWARTGRRSRRLGYIGQIFTYPVPLALLLWAVDYWMDGSADWWPVVAATLVVRALSAWVTSCIVLKANINWLLLPCEDLLGFVFWIAGFFGNSITWRGRTYRLDREGRAIAYEPAAYEPAA
jgi:ceramide glucosyltransferase